MSNSVIFFRGFAHIVGIAGAVSGVGVIVAVLVACAGVSSGETAPMSGIQPDPALDPQQVVAIQLDALGSSGGQIEGIEIAFRFASPANRAVTGPAPRFAGMLRGPVYNIMLHYDRVEYAPVVIDGTTAMQRVILYRDDESAVFDFYLRRQIAEPYVDCWMTEGVMRFRPPRPPRPIVPAPNILSV